MKAPARPLTTVLWATPLLAATIVAGSGCGKSSWPNDVCLQPPLTEAVATDEETPVGSAVAWAHVITASRSWEVVESVGFVGVIGTTPDVAWLGEVMPTDGPHAPQLLHVGTDCEPWLRFYWRGDVVIKALGVEVSAVSPVLVHGQPPSFWLLAFPLEPIDGVLDPAGHLTSFGARTARVSVQDHDNVLTLHIVDSSGRSLTLVSLTVDGA